MKNVVLRVGPHKTGTTQLQYNLAKNRAALLDQGIAYPEEWQQPQYGHHELAAGLKKLATGGDVEAFVGNCRRVLAGHFQTADTVLLSSENFDRLSEQAVGILARCLAGYDTKIVIYARSWGDLLTSFWSEEIKHGATVDMAGFLLSHLMRPLASRLLNYAYLPGLFAKGIPGCRICVVSYDNVVASEWGFSRYFIEKVVGAACPATVEDHRTINRRLPVEETEVVRALNMLTRTKGRLAPMAAFQLVRQLKAAGDPGLATLLAEVKRFRRSFDIVDMNETAGFRMAEKRFLDRYGQSLLNPTARGRLFESPRPAEFAHVADGYWAIREVRDILDGLAERIERR